ncbi:MAG: hypothetical protein AB7P08_17160 [Burkholderiales bacterium]
MSAVWVQALLAVLTLTGLALVSRAGSRHRLELAGWVAMLAAQPFWLAAAWLADQPGVLLVSAVYTVVAVDAVNVRIRRLFGSQGARR